MNSLNISDFHPSKDQAEQEQGPQIQQLMQDMSQLKHHEMENDAQLARIELKLDEVLDLLRQSR